MKWCYWLGHQKRVLNTKKDYLCPRCKESHWSDYDDTFWVTDTGDYIKFTLVFVLLVLVVLALIVVPSIIINSRTCQGYAELGVPAVWKFWTGCMAHSEKFGWIPVDQYFNLININIP